jgi:glucuronoarabinoxylan endo-1,4-beta-xylanase
MQPALQLAQLERPKFESVSRPGNAKFSRFLSFAFRFSIFLILAAAPSFATSSISRVSSSSGMGQGMINEAGGACSSGGFSVTLPHATGSGKLIFFAVGIYSGTQYTSSNITATLGGTSLTKAAGFEANVAVASGNYWVSELFYATSYSSGKTALQINVGTCGSNSYAYVQYGEYTTTQTGFAFDIANTQAYTSSTSACSGASCAGPGLSLTGSNDVIVQLGLPYNGGFTAVSGSYTLYSASDGMGGADNINSSSGAAVTWTDSYSGDYALTAAGGFYDTKSNNNYTATPSETNTASDSLGRTATLARADSETNTASDSLGRVLAARRSDAETNTTSDSTPTRLATLGRNDSESNTASDSLVAARNSHPWTATITESLTFTDSAGRTATLYRSYSETNTASDASPSRTAAFKRSDSETNPSADGLTRLATLARGDSESNTASDSFAEVYTSGGATITINWSTVYQTIDGFGASTADTTLNTGMPSSLADFFFRQDIGIGLSILRLQVVPSTSECSAEFTTANGYGYNGTCVSSSSGTILEGELATAQEAQARGVTRFFASQWSPSGTYKSNGSYLTGGALVGSTANYQAIATELAGFVSLLSANGVPIMALSPQNEPEQSQDYPSCTWNASQFDAFVPYLYADLPSSTMIIIPENSSWNTTYGGFAATCMNDSACGPDVGVLAQHEYGGGDVLPGTFTYNPNRLWSTEYGSAFGGGSYEGDITDAVGNAQIIHNLLTVANVNAFVWWFLSDEPFQGYGTDNSALTDESGDIPLRAYMTGNWSKFVRPGWHRVGVTNSGSLLVTAFQDPLGIESAVVVVNTGSSSVSQNFTVGSTMGPNVTPWITSSSYSLAAQSAVAVSGGSFSYTIPASSIVTFQAGLYAAGMAETNTASDSSPARQAGFSRAGSETNPSTDGLARQAAYSRADSETNTANDVLSRLATYLRAAAESNIAGDALSGLKNNHSYQATLAEALSFSDALARLSAY